MFARLILLLLGTKFIICANVLYVSMVPSGSHHIWNRVFASALGRKGHNVTLFGLDKEKQPYNYTHIHAEGVYDIINANFDMLKMAESTPSQTMFNAVSYSIISCKAGLRTQGLQQLLNYPQDFKFDLIVIDIAVEGCFYPLIHRFNYPPTIAVTPWPLTPFMAYPFGGALQPSYNPWYALPYTDDMTLIERFWNHIFTYGEIVARQFIEFRVARDILDTFGAHTPSWKKLERHISLLLSNHDSLLNYPQVLPPNIIPVGGLHIVRNEKIPKDLELVLNGAADGIIIFSLGTTIRSEFLGKDTQTSLLKAFSKLSQTVIWKFESEMDNLPKNVIIRKWLPQSDILGHRNVKLFIGHAGGLSTQEAIYHGVPMVCTPFFFDQHINAKALVRRKFGVSVDYRNVTTEYVLAQIREVLYNPIYSSNIKKVSAMYRDQKESALERAVFWADYTMRHNGCQILSTRARDLPFYKVLSLDIIILFGILCLATCYLLCRIINLILTLRMRAKLKIN